MIQQTISVNQRTIKDVQKRLKGIENKAPNAISSALNRTISNLATSVNKEVRADYQVKSTDIKKTLVKKTANPNSLSASLRSKGRVLGLDHFKVSPKTVQPKRKKPIKVAVKKSGLKSLDGAFVANANGPKVFVRTSKNRLPIKKLFGPSIPQMFKSRNVQEKVNTQATAKFKERLNHEINRLVERSTAS